MKSGLIRAVISTGTSHLRHTTLKVSSPLIRNNVARHYINAALRTVTFFFLLSLSLSLSLD